jgi:putative transcriptional regulator
MELVGNILIAPPAVKNSFWQKTVILITEHSPQGTLGLVLNKPSNMTFVDFGAQLNTILNIPGNVYVGGPINNHSMSMIHTNEWRCKNTMQINSSLSVSSADDILPRLSVGDCPKHWRLFLGMCGWAPGQLMNEFRGVPPFNRNHSWCISKSSIDLSFDYDGMEQWGKYLDKSGLEFAQTILS